MPNDSVAKNIHMEMHARIPPILSCHYPAFELEIKIDQAFNSHHESASLLGWEFYPGSFQSKEFFCDRLQPPW